MAASTPAGFLAAVSALLLLVQIAVILVVARLFGAVMHSVGQPRVMGEMLAGLVLGPSVLGWLAPAASQALFPDSSLRWLEMLSQAGVVGYMFLVGLELDLRPLRLLGRSAVAISLGSVVVPFAMGGALAVLLYPVFSGPAVSRTVFCLFLGAAMSVTAFPVLARLLAERGLMKTRLGPLSIAAAGVADLTVWLLLAVLISAGRAGPVPLPSPVFLAFLAGVITPRENQVVRRLERLRGVLAVLFLPLFFAFTGLRTSVPGIDGQLWVYGALILVVAVAGKMVGAAVPARATGLSWRESWAIGTLMNARGLMELVILNIGLDRGLLSPALFTLMVLMTLVTTLMTTPVLTWIDPLAAQHLAGSDRVDRDQQPVLLE